MEELFIYRPYQAGWCFYRRRSYGYSQSPAGLLSLFVVTSGVLVKRLDLKAMSLCFLHKMEMV